MIYDKKDKYKNCIEDISDASFSESNINRCVGEDLEFFHYDVIYEKYKIMASIDSRIKAELYDECFKIAGTEESFAQGCDEIQKDALDLMWQGFDFYNDIKNNGEIYTFTKGAIGKDNFINVLNQL